MPENTAKEIRQEVDAKIAQIRHKEQEKQQAPTLRVNEGEEKNLSTSVKHEKLDPSRLMTADEQQAYEAKIKHQEAEKEKDNKKVGLANRNSKYHDGFEKNKGPIFEQGDIIDYMFKQLLKGGDWLVNKGLDGIGWACYSISAYIGDSYADIRDAINKNKENKNKETTKFAEELTKEREAYLKTRQYEINKNIPILIKGLSAEFQNGNIDLVKGKPELYKALQQTPPETLKKLFTPENANLLTDKVTAVSLAFEQFTSNYATAQMLAEKAANQKAFSDTDVKTNFNLKRKEAALVFNDILALAEKEQNPQILKDAVKLSVEAMKQETQGIKDGLYKEIKGNPLPNKHLDGIKELIQKGHGMPNEPLNLNNPQNFVNRFINADKTFADELNILNERINERKAENEQRRAKFEKLTKGTNTQGSKQTNFNNQIPHGKGRN